MKLQFTVSFSLFCCVKMHKNGENLRLLIEGLAPRWAVERLLGFDDWRLHICSNSMTLFLFLFLFLSLSPLLPMSKTEHVGMYGWILLVLRRTLVSKNRFSSLSSCFFHHFIMKPVGTHSGQMMLLLHCFAGSMPKLLLRCHRNALGAVGYIFNSSS